MSTVEEKKFEIPDGLKQLVGWYGAYAKEIVKNRAIPGIDGLKPSQRRILYSMKELAKVKELTKSTTIVGTVLRLHPHGDASAYETLVRMVNKHEAMGTPFIHGKGDFGKTYDNEPPAASRYTEAKFTDLADELFTELKSTQFVPTEDGHEKEPVTLPVSYPSILTNASSGIAVGMSSNIPQFNFHEVIEKTIELEETGDIEGYLVPDFTTGANYVENEKELRKMMDTGNGKVKLRGDWYVEGRNIIIDSVPYYTTTNAIMKEAKKIDGVSAVKDLSGIDQLLKIQITCSNKGIVDRVLNDLLRYSGLQLTITTNIVVIIDDKPRVIGIKELLSEWLKFRKDIVRKHLESQLASSVRSIRHYEVLVNLLQTEERREEFTSTLVKKNDVEARKLLVEWYPEAEKDTLDWILDMKMRSFSNAPAKARHLDSLKAEKAVIENDLANLSAVIVRQLKEVSKRYKFPRRTKITDVDYDFSGMKNEVVKVKAVPTLVVVEGKFVKKLLRNRLTENINGIACMSDDVISFIDDKGRLFRLSLDNIEFTDMNAQGVYLPVYLEIEDDFEIIVSELIEDKKVGYVYDDGFVSVLDYNEWVDSRRTTRITTYGVSPYAGQIMAEFDFEKQYLMLMTNTGKFGFVSTDFKQKHRTARTKLVAVKEGETITSVTPVTYSEMVALVNNPLRYADKLSNLHVGDKFNSELFKTLRR